MGANGRLKLPYPDVDPPSSEAAHLKHSHDRPLWFDLRQRAEGDAEEGAHDGCPHGTTPRCEDGDEASREQPPGDGRNARGRLDRTREGAPSHRDRSGSRRGVYRLDARAPVSVNEAQRGLRARIDREPGTPNRDCLGRPKVSDDASGNAHSVEMNDFERSLQAQLYDSIC